MGEEGVKEDFFAKESVQEDAFSYEASGRRGSERLRFVPQEENQEVPHLPVDDFLYERQGPWPQPAPANPGGEPPAVVHVPWRETLRWWLCVGSRYLLVVLFWTPVFFIKSLFNREVEEVSDREFEELICTSVFSKSVKFDFDEADVDIFKTYFKEGERYAIADYSVLDVLVDKEGMYSAATRTLFRVKGERSYEAVAIWIDGSVFCPGDGDAWELSKYYALQGAALTVSLVTHPAQHFPLDSINAITKTVLPRHHVLFQLLYPHTDLTLGLEKAVLYYKSSLLNNKWWMTYAPYPCEAYSLRRFLEISFRGIKDNDSYPAYEYPMRKLNLPDSEYGDFLRGYHQECRKFVAEVVKKVVPGDPLVKSWAAHISHHLPGFPGAEEIFEGENLLEAVSYYFWSVTFDHSADHYCFGKVSVRKAMLRLRQPPPKDCNVKLNRRSLLRVWDQAKHRMADRLFFEAHAVTYLMKCRYEFADEDLQQEVRKFKSNLRDYESKLQVPNYMPLDKVAASIQY